jgi:hypothetical protein
MHKWADLLKTFGFFIIIGIVIAVTKVIQNNRYDDEMRDSIVVTGKVINLQRAKGNQMATVSLPFNGHLISSICETSVNDSLIIGDSIRLRVSIYDPTTYTAYIGHLNHK